MTPADPKRRSWFRRSLSVLVSHGRASHRILQFTFGKVGDGYGLTRLKRARLVWTFIANNRRTRPLSRWQQHLEIAETLLQIPRSTKGDVVECGCYTGGSTANLSIVCGLVGRRLYVCDSFKGLPKPDAGEEFAVVENERDFYRWEEGDFAPDGGAAQVRQAVEQFGNIEACVFVEGFYKDTLKDLTCEKIAMVFEDADLPSSVKDCLTHLWPRLQPDGLFYSHEPFSADVVGIFYDRPWWQRQFGSEPPGFVGSGLGLPRAPGLGYAKKITLLAAIENGDRVMHQGCRSVDR